MTQSGKSKEEVIAMIKEAKRRKEASKSWADYDPNEPFDPSDLDFDFDFLPKRKINIPPPIDTNLNKGKIDNPILNDKDELYNLISKQLPQNNLEQILNYLQEINNNVQLPISFKNAVKRFVEQFNTIDETTNSFVPHITLAIDINLPDIDEQQTEISEDILAKHIKDIMKEHLDVLDILTTRHVIKLLEARLNTNLQQYKPFIKKTISENIPKEPKPQPKPEPQPSMEDLFGPESPSPKDEEIEIEPPKRKSPKQKSKSKSPKRKSPKQKSKKSKSPKRKSVKKSKSKKSKSPKRKSVKKSKSKKSKSVKRKSVKKSKKAKSVKKSKSVKRKSVKKSKKAKSVKKSKSVKRKSVKKSKSKKAKSVKRSKSKSKKAKSVKKSKSVKRKSVKKSKSKKAKSVKRKSVKKSKSKKAKSVKRKSVKKSKKAKSVKKSKKAKSVKKSKSKKSN
jgi:hypothetical protein